MFECFWELWEGICENWAGAGSSLVTLTFKKGPTTVHFRPSDILLRSYNSHFGGEWAEEKLNQHIEVIPFFT